MWTKEIIEGQPPRCQAVTGLRADQVTDLVTAVFDLLGGIWQPIRGRRRMLGLYRAVVLTLYLMRRNEAQAVAGELFCCSQSTVSRIVRRLRPLLRQATADLAGQVRQQTKRSAVLVDGFLAPTGNRTGIPDLFSGKRHAAGLDVQAVSDLAGRLLDTGLPVPGARRLFATLIANTIHPINHRLRWSWWRRQHQTHARTSHHRRRGHRIDPLSST